MNPLTAVVIAEAARALKDAPKTVDEGFAILLYVIACLLLLVGAPFIPRVQRWVEGEKR